MSGSGKCSIKVGINGFGRIGRIVFRTCCKSADMEVVAINDPGIPLDYLCYLIKFDSTYGNFEGEVKPSENGVLINGKFIHVSHERSPCLIPWSNAGVKYVVEASGLFTTYSTSSGHLNSKSVIKVVITAPSPDVPMMIAGVNDQDINSDAKIVSCTSSTLHCLASIIKVLDDNFGVIEGFVSIIHAMTPSLKPVDGLCTKGKHWRDYRSIHQNVIPASTGACKALGKILPNMANKLSGIAFRVPIVNVSILDLTVRLALDTTLSKIFKKVEEASRTSFKNVIKTNKEGEVSSDFIGDEHSCIVDTRSCLALNPNFFKIICWYENEYSYACRVLDTIRFFESHTKVQFPVTMVKQLIPKKTVAPLTSAAGLQTKEIPKLEVFKSSKHIKQLEKHNIDNDLPIIRTQQEQCLRTRQRLEKVKQDFSKMIQLTRELLKKSCDYDEKSKRSTTRSCVLSEDKHTMNSMKKIGCISLNHTVTSSLHDCNKAHNNSNINIVPVHRFGYDKKLSENNLSKEIATNEKNKIFTSDCTKSHEIKFTATETFDPISKQESEVNNLNYEDCIAESESKYVVPSRSNSFILSKENLNNDAVGINRRSSSMSDIGKNEDYADIRTNAIRNSTSYDIYDKLDSVSCSNSDADSNFNERKSVVLNISDLTNSLENLEKLDKICRIMEISDELSDNLFKALKSPIKSASGKWSLKNLCEEIKLQEFCENLHASMKSANL